ncbi:uncharacterized protein LOC124635571 isoform X1 [Helicoverpa zea]|uniref:uncharacterized protein LOC124635571 isoform X1 n=1 Tax=Helicoverpa zea TaxID=7113 RepID=UPI001F58BEF6|nr:uncharacterized protein LOC124635571 isoform X1 [Helicoverpa zea]
MFIFVKRNILQTLSFISGIGLVTCIVLHCTTKISPLTGISFPGYVLGVFLVCVHITFRFIQATMLLHKPIKYDLDVIMDEYPYMTVVNELIRKRRKKKSRVSEIREYDTDELSVISTVLERKLVSSWYVPYISQEIGFPFACKQMLDQMIGKSFQICNKIEIKDVYVDLTTILTSHLNEYQRAQKRQENSLSIPVENFYKKSHPVFNPANKLQPADHCTNLLRIVFKELIPWELWDTPHSELLVRILSKKLDNFIDSTLADPRWLNDKLLTILQGKQEPTVTEVKKEPEKAPVPEEVPKDKKSEPVNTVTEPPPVVPKSTVMQVVQEEPKVETEVEKIESIVEEVPVTSTEPVDIKTSPVLRQRRGRQGRNEVKIYDRIIEGSVKTWETDIDLQCISLGQDLLASLDGEITLSRLWGHDNDGSPNPPRGKSPQPLWFGEEETIEVDPLDANIFKDQQTKKEQSPKPADALLKDLQSTVREAKTKIGDLQVSHTLALDVPRKQNSSDEAAGMMEGLLDFGIAGLKKGLRFTGLSDDSDKSPSHRASDRSPPAEPRPMIAEHKEPHTKENNNGHRDENNVPQLVKQHRVTSQDIVPSLPRAVPRAEGLPAPLPDSPEPEYEEAADLSTSIAKLRCLLQQRAETSPRAERAEEVWWESAEETRGRAQQHHSLRPVDTATLADEYDMNMDRNSSPSQTSNNMQRLDKLFQRTVTGVFNSLKTAVGAEGEQPTRTLHDWTYVATAIDLNVCGAVSRLVGSRRACSHVEAALDSLAQLPARRRLPAHEPVDYEEWCAACGAGWSGSCAVLAAAGLVRSHVAHRLATMIIADIGEALIDVWLSDLAAWLRKQVFVVFEQMQKDSDYFQPKENLRPFNLDETCEVLMEKLPAVMYAFGAENLSPAVRLLVTSLSSKQINSDVTYRALDILVAHFKKSAALRNPSFDNN